MKEKLLYKHEYRLGEDLYLISKFYDNGDAAHGLPVGVFLNQELVLVANCNSASFKLYSTLITPEVLRELADELEEIEKTVKTKVKVKKQKK